MRGPRAAVGGKVKVSLSQCLEASREGGFLVIHGGSVPRGKHESEGESPFPDASVKTGIYPQVLPGLSSTLGGRGSRGE